MRIAFDGTTLQPGRTGVGYYTEHLLHHLAHEAGDDQIVVVSNRRPDFSTPLPPNVEVVTSRTPIVRIAWMQLMAPGVLRAVKADVAHFTNGMMPIATPIPTVVTIHDMSLTLYPECHPLRRLVLNRPLVRRAAHQANAIITVSNSAKRDIVRLYGLDPGRVHVIHEAAAPAFQRVTDRATLESVRTRHRLPERFILYVGTIEPRKNLPRLLEAFARRHRAGDLTHDLVCVGPYGWLSRDIAQRIASLGIGDAVHFVGYVPFADLPAIYSLSDLFVFPSLYEGFGLPVLEAMACGTPVIIGRNPSLVEITGDAVDAVDPLDTDALGDAIARLANDDARRRTLAERGLARSGGYSWARAARETLDVYRQVVQLRAPIGARPKPLDSGPWTLDPGRPGSVLFGQAYYLRFDPKLWTARQPYPPLGTLYAASYLRQQGHRVALFDAMLAESEAEWAAALDRERPRLAVIYEDSFNYLSKMCLLRMRVAALKMIELAKARGIPVIVSGSDATDHPSIYLKGGAAFVIIGEGEVTLAELTASLLETTERTRPGDIKGLCFTDERGEFVRTPARETIRDLDQLPFPAWDLVDVARYREIWRAHHGHLSMNLVTTRGCPYHCNWCAKPIYGQRYAVRSPAHVVDEMAWLAREHAPDHLWIVDDIFGLKPGWIQEFADLVVARGAAIPFRCLMRADQVTAEIVGALKAARCQTVWLGAESGSQRVLDAMEKGTRVGQIADASRYLQRAGIQVGFFLQFGYPGETRDDIDRTLQMVRDCRPDDIGVSVSYPLPGTRFYDRVRADLGDKQNWFDSSDLTTMYHATYGPEFYRILHAAVHAEFRLTKAAAAVSTARRPWTFAPSHARLLGGAALNALKLPLLRWQLDQLSQVPSVLPAEKDA